MEVRCCCQPKKLLGWIAVPDETQLGDCVAFSVIERIGTSEAVAAPSYLSARVILPVAEFMNGDDRHLALKSEETPVATLRRIPSFIEHTDRSTL